METGIVFDIRRYSIHDGPGIRTTVFLKGCPLACTWCHNPESQPVGPAGLHRRDRCIGCGECLAVCPEQCLSRGADGIVTDASRCVHCGACCGACPAEARELVGRPMSVAGVLDEILKDETFYDESGGGVTFSGGEPLAQGEFLVALLWACGHSDIHRAVDTSGLADPELLARVAEHTDLFLYDLKIMDGAEHRRHTGVENGLILRNLQMLSKLGARLRIRIPLIPGINMDARNLDAAGGFIAALPTRCPVDLLPYHDWAKGKYSKFNLPFLPGTIAPPREAEVEGAAQRLRRFGLEVGIGG